MLNSLAAIDDSDGYHARHLDWRWSIGMGVAADGRAVAWNLVTGINDPDTSSERTVWVDGEPHEVGPVVFAQGLDRIDFTEGGSLVADIGAVRVANDNRLLVRSAYRQPFADFTGSLPGVGELVRGHGVMEQHNVYW